MTTVDDSRDAGVAVPATAEELGLMSGSPPRDERLVTVSSWQEGPNNRWAFQHVGENQQIHQCRQDRRRNGMKAHFPEAHQLFAQQRRKSRTHLGLRGQA